MAKLIYCVENKLGGVSSLNYNLMSFAPEKGPEQWIVHIDMKESDMARTALEYPVSRNIDFQYSSRENRYSVIRRLRGSIPEESGALIVNYHLEMEMLDNFPIKQTVYQLVHDNYNFKLASRYHHVVDVFIAHNKAIYERLIQEIPQRASDIFYLCHGVTVPPFFRQHDADADRSPLKLLFLGRMTAMKGIFDLPVINDLLRKKGIAFEWTCIGNGPELPAIKEKWNPLDPVTFISPSSNEEVLRITSRHDVFVLPTKFEGSPVSLLETMSVGLVPVITDLEGGIRETVNDRIGYKIPEGDNQGFADAIGLLYHNRNLLADMSRNCREKITESFNILNTARSYHDLFMQFETRFRSKSIKKAKVGARLDQPWIPSNITRGLRTLLNK
jgi:glycosyltransferase involved in cell wall biosynthesis